MRDKKKVIFLILTGSGGVRGHKKGHKKALSDISYEGPIRYLHQTLHIGVKNQLSGKAFFLTGGFSVGLQMLHQLMDHINNYNGNSAMSNFAMGTILGKGFSQAQVL